MASRLERYEDKYRSLASALSEIGFISQGSLVLRKTSCGKPGCKCQGKPPQLHGPYYQWSRLVNGKTASRRLSAPEAELYREWIANRRELKRIVAEMENISALAGEILLSRVGEHPGRTRRRQ
jgi:hypothetical protein